MNTQQQQEKLQRHLGYLEQDNNNVTLLLAISDLYRQLRDGNGAQRYLDEAKRLSTQPFWAHQGLLHLDLKQIDPAKYALTQALIEEDTPTNRYQLAFCLYLNRDFNDALAVLNAPDNPLSNSAILLKAKILHHLQQADEAIVILEQLIITQNSDAETLGLLALLHFDNNSIDRAEFLSTQALAINAADSNGQLVRILLKTLGNDVTIEEIESLLTIMPEESRLWFALGTTEMRDMNFSAAEIAFAKATQIGPEFYDGWISLGWCHLLQDNLDKAETTYQQAVKIDADDADGWGGLALVNALRGNSTEAKQWLEKTRPSDSECFLAAVTQIIIANQENPNQAVRHLHTALPDLPAEVNQILTAAILNINDGGTTFN